MKLFNVKYLLSDDDCERLEKIRSEYKSKGLDLSPEDMFESIMITGSTLDINNKFEFHEIILKLIKN